MEFLDDDDRSELNALRDKLHELRGGFHDAKRGGDRAAAHAIALEAGPLQARARELEGLRAFGKVCPIVWIHGATEAEIESRIADATLKKFAGEPDAIKRSALLLGPSKIGKSTTAALALRRALTAHGQKLDVRWYYARALAQAARQYPLGEGVCPEVERASKADLLILDDLGLERDAAELVDVVHSRYETGLVTWTTSGLTMGELRERYGEALVRRLIEGREQPGRVVSMFGKAAQRGHGEGTSPESATRATQS
jgi:hypothetical protein